MNKSSDDVQVIAHHLARSGDIPNHPRWPLLLYPGAVVIIGPDPAQAFETLFDRNHWPAAWRKRPPPFRHWPAALQRRLQRNPLQQARHRRLPLAMRRPWRLRRRRS